MKEETIEQVRNSGFKIKYLAGVIGIHKNQLSMALRGERSITPEQENRLITFLTAIPNMQLR